MPKLKNLIGICVLVVCFVALSLALSTAALAAEPEYAGDIRTSTRLLPSNHTPDSSAIYDVTITANGDADKTYRVFVKIKSPDPTASGAPDNRLNEVFCRIDFERTDFLPKATTDSKLQGDSRIAILKDPTTGAIKDGYEGVEFTFNNLIYQGDDVENAENRRFSFYYTDETSGIKQQFGSFQYTVAKNVMVPPDTGGTIFVPDTNPLPPAEESSEPIQIASLVPHLLVESYSYGDAVVTAGQDFVFTFKLKNYSRNKTIENVVIMVTPSEGVQIRSATNTYYIESVKSGDVISKSIKLRVPIGTAVETQSITVKASFEYYDKKNEDPVKTEDEVILAIPSTKIHRAKITSIKATKKFKEGKSGTIEYGFVNNGFATIYNAEAFLYDEKGEEIGWQFIGNLESGTASKDTKFEVEFKEGGDGKNLKLVIVYENDNLARFEDSKEFKLDVEKLEVVEMPETPGVPPDSGELLGPDGQPIDGGIDMYPEGQGSKFPVLPVVGGVVGVGALATFLILRKRHKNKQEKNYDNYFEDLDTALTGEETKPESTDADIDKNAES